MKNDYKQVTLRPKLMESRLILRDITPSINRENPVNQVLKRPEIDEIRSLLRSASLPDNELNANRTLLFRGSTDHLDRYKTIFSLRGWDFVNYRSNPVFLYQHNRDCMADSKSMPVGRSLKEYTVLPQYRQASTSTIKVKRHQRNEDGDIIRTTEVDIPNPDNHIRVNPISNNSADDGTGMFQLVYFPEGKDSEAVLEAFNTGLLNTVSVGVKPRTTIYPEDMSPDQRAALGNPDELYVDQELYELSAVTLPGNPKAVKMALERGLKPEFINILGLDDEDRPLNERFGNIRSVINLLNREGPELISLIRKNKGLKRKIRELKKSNQIINNKLDQIIISLAVNSPITKVNPISDKQESAKQASETVARLGELVSKFQVKR